MDILVTYICKYTPVELLSALGQISVAPNEEVEDFASADAYLHSSVCAHARQLFSVLIEESGSPRPLIERQSPERGEGSLKYPYPEEERTCQDLCEGPRHLVLTTCCDSIRRVADALPQGLFDTRTMLDLPHRADDVSARLYGRELERLLKTFSQKEKADGQESLEEMAGAESDPQTVTGMEKSADAAKGCQEDGIGNLLSVSRRKKLLDAWAAAAEENDTFADTCPDGFLALLGARAGRQLFAQLESRLPLPVIDLTCGGKRHLSGPPEGAESLKDRELLTAYARALLSQIPCMRMENISRRERLLKSPGLRGILYHTVRFCDYYAFEYAALRKKTALPMLKLESDFTAQSEGQLATRISAFAESLKSAARKPSAPSRRPEAGRMSIGGPALPRDPSLVFIGIDSGSTTTNAAALGSDGRLLASCVLRTGPRAADAAAKALTNVRSALPEGARIACVFATGYGRDYIAFADGTRTEISCHGKGANYLYANARCVIDIGGQDSKVICLGEGGEVTNFVMNDKCAAGTGRFLEMMAATLEMKLPELSRRGLSWKKEITISSVCTVFAESEVVSLIAQNNAIDDIVHALNKSVAVKTVSMVRRVRGEGPFVMTGGVARNEGLVRELSRQLGESVLAPKTPDLAGAIGAALLAMESM